MSHFFTYWQYLVCYIKLGHNIYKVWIVFLQLIDICLSVDLYINFVNTFMLLYLLYGVIRLYDILFMVNLVQIKIQLSILEQYENLTKIFTYIDGSLRYIIWVFFFKCIFTALSAYSVIFAITIQLLNFWMWQLSRQASINLY